MRTIILAAGQGTRLRPYTDHTPKCMVELAGTPLLHRQLATLDAAGLDDRRVLVGGYCADRLDGQGADVVLNPRYDQTNMVATLFCAHDNMVDGEDLLICYGDIIYEPNVLQAILDGDAPLCLAADREWRRLWQLRMDEPLDDAETFVMDAEQRISDLGKPPQSYDQVHAQYMGLIKVRGDRVADFKAAYDALDRDAIYDGKDFDNMYMTSFIQHLIDSGWDTRACLVDNGWLEVDTADELETYQRMAEDGSLQEYCRLD